MYRSLLASDLSWRTLAIVQGHTRRWLVEVFIQDWKSDGCNSHIDDRCFIYVGLRQ
jgi:hypothetical protein